MESHTRTKLQAITVIAGIVASVAAGAFFMPANQQSIIPQAYSQSSASIYPTIKVTGEASKTLVADQATIIVSVQSQSDDLDELLEDHIEDVHLVRNAVAFAHITTDRQLIELRDSGESNFASYFTTTRLVVKTFPVDIDRVIDGLRQFNNTTIEDIFLSVSDKEIDAIRTQLTNQAIDEAEERAEEIANRFNLDVRKILSIEVVPGQANTQEGETFYRGVKVVDPYYHERITGEFLVSVIVEFELRAE